MKTGTKQNKQAAAPDLPAWADCDAFCIHDYAGTGKQPCGWRGLFAHARNDPADAKVLCPRCGYATLFPIPPGRADS